MGTRAVGTQAVWNRLVPGFQLAFRFDRRLLIPASYRTGCLQACLGTFARARGGGLDMASQWTNHGEGT